MKYNQLTVLEEISKSSRRYYRVQCDCGNISEKRKDWVISGRTKSCKSCSAKRTASKYPPPINAKGFGNFSGTHYLHLINGAKRRGIPFNVSAQFLWELYLKQDGKCALTGVQLCLNRSLRKQNVNWHVITASLDRIDSTKDYTEDNVWWVHKEVNRLKNKHSLDELLYWCKLIVEKHDNPEPSSLNDNIVSEKVQRLTGEESTNNPDTSAQQPYKHLSYGYSSKEGWYCG